METITIKAFRAVDDRVRCARYLIEHIRVLEDIGVASALKPDISWCTDPDVVVIVAEHPRLGMVAGIRLHKAKAGHVLPMERSLRDLDPTIAERLAELMPSGNGEIAGLRNAHRFAGRGVPMLLMEAVVSIANQLALSSLVTFIAEYVAPYARKCGFVLMEDLRNGGDFIYPVPSIRTHAMVLPDMLTLSASKPEDRQRILSLRLRPSQVRDEQPKKVEIEVTYELIVDKGMRDRYSEVSRWWRQKAA
jgi:hypothetical protein